mgnify:FL=1|tara:strand:- start:44717 stop:45028 length:312 start_codon:yes stop_codon:yes gene_type:complete
MELIKISDLNSIDDHSGKVVMVEDSVIALFKIQDEYFAIDNVCPHRGGSLGDGEVTGVIVSCPWHGWEINCKTGEAVENPNIKVKRYEIIKKEDGIYIEWEED